MTTVTVDNSDPISSGIKYDDVDLSEYTEEELRLFGVSEEDIKEIFGKEEEDEEEKEDEEEDEPEEEEEEPEEEEEKPKKREPRIPKSRFDEAVAKEREKAIRAEERSKYLEERINELLALKEQIQTKPTEDPESAFDFDEAETKYAELLLEGEAQEAAKLRIKINKERDKYLQEVVKSVKEEAKKATKDLSVAEKKEVVIQQALTEYEFLNEESESYNEDLVMEINALAAGYEVKGKMSPDKALQKAIDRLAKPMLKKEEVKKTLGERKAKKVETMKKQPPNTSGAKSVKDKTVDDFDWENMSQAEFRDLYKKSPKLVQEALRKAYV
jgi:hypothetical protein